jgi:hypothetical protein
MISINKCKQTATMVYSHGACDQTSVKWTYSPCVCKYLRPFQESLAKYLYLIFHKMGSLTKDL